MAALPYAFRALPSAFPVACRRAALVGAGLVLPVLLAVPAVAADGAETTGTPRSTAEAAVRQALEQAASALPQPVVPTTVPPSAQGGSGMSGLPVRPPVNTPATVPEPSAPVSSQQPPTEAPASPASPSGQDAQPGPEDGDDCAEEAEETGDTTTEPTTAPAAPATVHSSHSSADPGAVAAAVAPTHGRHTRSAAAVGHPAHGRAAGAATTAARPAAPESSADLAEALPGATAAAPLPQAADVAAPLRWSDPSTRQLPLGAGLTLIGIGLAMVGLRMRRG
ncbi:hypothetical protein [Kitasatospora sp. NPDC051914]|uniref:hypothetical protein n=1 Tax=Kitasatospora sp. NPDC051914 TaxID=3154945 RepID=UPI00342802C3